MNEIGAILRSASEDGSENILTPEDVQNWLAEYMQMHDKEMARFPAEKDFAHWDLLAAEYDSSRHAVFALAFFRGDSLTFLAGRGNASDVRDFGENNFPTNPEHVLDQISSRFWIAGRLTVTLEELNRWLENDNVA